MARFGYGGHARTDAWWIDFCVLGVSRCIESLSFPRPLEDTGKNLQSPTPPHVDALFLATPITQAPSVLIDKAMGKKSF
jgi:hypothetical protein